MAERQLKVIIRGDSSGAQRALRQLSGAFDGTERRLTTLGNGLFNVGKFTTIAALGNQALALSAALAPAAGSLGALPAVLGNAGAAAATLKVGLSGVGEALKAAASSDAEKLSEALKGLAPNARSFVTEFAAIKTAFGPIRTAVQQNLFTNLAGQMKELGRVSLPTLRSGMIATSESMSGLAQAALKAAATPMFQGSMLSVFRNASDSLAEFIPAVGSLTIGLGRLAAAGGPFITQFSAWAASGLDAAGAFLSSEDGINKMTRAMQAGGEALGTLKDIALNVGSAIYNIFSQTNSGTLLADIEGITKRFAEWTGSAEGAEDLRLVFSSLAEIASHLADVIPAVAGAFVELFAALDSIPDPIREAVFQLAAWAIVLGPVVKGIAALSVGAKGVVTLFSKLSGPLSKVGGWLAKLGPLVARLGPLLLVALSNPITAVIAVVAGLAAGLIWAYNNIEPFRSAVQAAGAAISQIWTALKAGDGEAAAKIFTDLLTRIGTFIRDVGVPFIQEKLGEWGQAFVDWIGPKIPVIIETLGTFLAAVGQWLIDSLPAIWEQLQKWGQAFIDWVGPKIPPMLAALGELLVALGAWFVDTALPAIVKQLAEWGLAFIKWVGPQIPKLLAELGKLLVDLGVWILTTALPAIVKQLAEWGLAFLGWVAGAVRDLPGKLLGLLGVITSFASGIPGKILGVLGDLGSLLYGVGSDLVQGFINGIASRIGAVIGTISAMVSSAVAIARRVLDSRSPSRVFMSIGRDVGDGFAIGVGSKRSAVATAMTSLVTPPLMLGSNFAMAGVSASVGGSSVPSTVDRSRTVRIDQVVVQANDAQSLVRQLEDIAALALPVSHQNL